MKQFNKAFECRIGEGDWWVMTYEELSAENAARVFAKLMVEQEWRMYDLKHAEKLAKLPVQVRYGEDGEIHEYKITKTRLSMEVEVKHV